MCRRQQTENIVSLTDDERRVVFSRRTRGQPDAIASIGIENGIVYAFLFSQQFV